MNREQQFPESEAEPSNGRNVRKRPRPKISLAGIQISAPPEYGFHASPTAQTSPAITAAPTVPNASQLQESGRASDFSSPPSTAEVTKVTVVATAHPFPVEPACPATPPHQACHLSTDKGAEQRPSNHAAIPDTPDSRKERSVGRSMTGHETSTSHDVLEQTPPHATNIFRNKKVHSLSDESSPKAVETPERSHHSPQERLKFPNEAVSHQTDAPLPTPELGTPNEKEQHMTHVNTAHEVRTSESWEECMLMERLDRNITMAEEDDILMRLDLDISTAEEEFILQKLQEEIEKDEAAAAAAAASASMDMDLDDESHLILSRESWEDDIPNQPGEGQQAKQNSWSEKSQKASEVMESLQPHLQAEYGKHVESSRQTDVARPHISTTAVTMAIGGHEKSVLTTSSVKQRDTIKILLTRKAKKGAVAFTENDFQLSFLPCFRREIEESDPTKLIDFGYTIRPNRNNGEYVFDLVAKGERSVLDTLLKRVKPWVKYRLTMAKLQQVVTDGDSQVFDLYARPEKLGITVRTFDQDLPLEYRESDEGGASFEITKLDGQIPDILGLKAIKSGAAIIAADGMAIGTASVLQEYLQQKIEKGAFVILTFCYDKKTNLEKATRYLSNVRRMRDEVRPPIALKSKLETESKSKETHSKENPTVGGDQVLEYPTADYMMTSALPKNPPLAERAIDEAVIHILENPRSVIVELLMPTAGTLGAKLYFKGTKSSGFLHHFNSEGPLARALGKQFGEWGAVLWTVNGTKIKSAPDFKTLKDQARNSKHYRLGLLCYDGIDLSGVDRTILYAPPRRQSGEKYPMHLQLPDKGDPTNRTIETLNDKEQEPTTPSQPSKTMARAISVDAGKVVQKPSAIDPEETRGSVSDRRRTSASTRTSKGLQLPTNPKNVASEGKNKKNDHSPKEGGVREPDVEKASPPEATKVIYLPFRVKSFGDHIFFDEKKFEKDFMEGFREDMQKEYPTKMRGFDYSITPDTARPDVYKLSASGDALIVDELMKRAMAWNRFTSATTKLDILFQDPNSIVVEFTTRATSFLGISFLNVNNLSQEHRRRLDHDQPGVWFGISDHQGMVVQKVGREISSIVAAIIAVNGSRVANEQQLHAVMNRDKDLDLVFTICVHKHTPLDRHKQGLKICQLKDTEYYGKLRAFSESSVGTGAVLSTDDDASILEYPPPGFALTSALPPTPPLKEEDIEIAIKRVLNDEKSVELELNLQITGPLGAQLCYPKARHVVGWLHRFRSGGTLSMVFGKAYGDWGAAVIRVNGKTIDSITRFREEIEKNMQPCRLSLLCFDGVDLSEMDRSKLVAPPRRRNGHKYPMHLYPKSSAIGTAPQTENEVAKRKRILPINEDNSSQRNRSKASSKDVSANDGQVASQPETRKSTSFEPPSKKSSGQTIFDSQTIPKKRLPEWNPSQLVSPTTHSVENPDDARRTDESMRSPRGKRKLMDALATGAIDLSTLAPPKLRRTESQTGGKSASGYDSVAKSLDFEKTFNSNEPLGAYFVTERIDGRNYCKVLSIQMGGQVFRENRIHKDTIVDSVVIGSRRDPIRTSKQLRTLYENAKKSRNGLTLVFKNPETISHSDPSHVDKNWSHDGKWEGGGLGGWAGGALDAWSKVSSVHITKSFATTNVREPQGQLVTNDTYVELHATSENNASSSLPHDGSDVVDALYESTDDQGPPSTQRRSVSLGRSTEFTIEPQSESGEPKKPSNGSTGSVRQLSRLHDAIENKTCQELINTLESGVSHDSLVVEKGLQEGYNAVKTKISQMNKDGESETGAKAMSDLNAKRKVLNIYINSTLLLEKALNLEHWGSFELRVLNADVRFLEDTNKTATANLMVSGKIKLGSVQVSGGKMENLGDVKPQSFQEFIVWDEGANSKVKFTNNPHILEPRHLQIELFTSHADDPNAKPDFLGMFQLPLDTISEACPNYETSVSIEIPVSLPNDNLKSGELTVEVQRVRTDHNYVRRKSDEVASKLSEQIDFIGRFKKDYEEELVFAPNIQGKNGKSLLHAAVHLRKQSLVQKLADLGATFDSDESENPLTKAMNQRDRAKKKLQEKVSSDEVDENAKRAYSESLAESEAIVEILKTMVSSSDKPR